jgi:hypothetical protein
MKTSILVRIKRIIKQLMIIIYWMILEIKVKGKSKMNNNSKNWIIIVILKIIFKILIKIITKIMNLIKV